MPVATALSADSCVVAASIAKVPFGQDEMGITGALIGCPLEMVPCETIPLEVPAEAEIVIEGWISPDEKEWELEGPFGEYTGHFGGGRRPRPVVNISAITSRKNPILWGTLEGHPPSESTTTRVIGHTVSFAQSLRRMAIPGFKDVVLTEMGCAGFTAVIQMERQYYPGYAFQLIAATWALVHAKWVIVVDSDIDIYDRGQVEWALSTRVQPHRDMYIIPDVTFGSILDPSINPDHKSNIISGRTSRVGIDATTQFKGFEFEPTTKRTPAGLRAIEEKWSWLWKEPRLLAAVSGVSCRASLRS